METVRLLERKIEVLNSHTLTIAVIVIATLLYVARAIQSQPDGVKAPCIGFRSVFEPAWLVRLRYSQQASSWVKDGYAKVFWILT